MTAELTSEQISQIMHGIAIPPQPQVMVDLQMEQMAPDCDFGEIARLISQDVGLSGSILKTVNSPFFNHTNTITSITQAVSLLGVNSVVNLVNALSIKGALSDDDIIAMGRFWDSSMDVAMAAAAIAKQIGYPNSDEAYTLGLFRDAGIPLLTSRVKNYSEVLRQAYACPDKRITTYENETINTNHAVVGYYVAKSWNLPLYLCEAIHEHHNVNKIFEKEEVDTRKKTLLAILKMAEHVCGTSKILGDSVEDYEWNHIKQTVLVYVGLGDYDYSLLAEQVSELGLGSTDYYS